MAHVIKNNLNLAPLIHLNHFRFLFARKQSAPRLSTSTGGHESAKPVLPTKVRAGCCRLLLLRDDPTFGVYKYPVAIPILT